MFAGPEEQDRTKAAGLAASLAADALLEHAAPQVGVEASSDHRLRRREKIIVLQIGLYGEAGERLGGVDRRSRVLTTSNTV
jgi:hypothetical protein